MSATFYGVLGVGPDADEATIRSAYRERVTDVHPDVSDDPDADAKFMRLKTAKETLLDGSERARYDRLGHASYVRHHVDCSAWTAGGATDRSRTATADDDRTGRDDSPGGDRTGDDPPRTGNARSDETGRDAATGQATEGDETGGADDRRESRRSTGTAGERQRRRAARTDDDRGNHGRSGPSGVRDRDDVTSGEANRRESRRRDSGGAGGSPGDTADRSRPPGYARSSFWHAQRAGERAAPAAPASNPFARRLLRGLRTLGPWVLVHAAFLAAAVGTSLYVYVVLAGPRASVPLLLVLVGEVVVAFLLSSVHVVSRLVP